MEEEKFKLSVSKVKTFDQCKKKYEYLYIVKVPRKEQIFHTFGKFAHKILEDFHNAYINGSVEPIGKEMTKAWKNALVEYEEKLTPELKKEAWDICNFYLKKIQKSGLPNVLSCEQSFEIYLKDNLILNGFIDRVEKDENGIYHVLDYKTSKSKSYLKDDYFQLITYAFVLLQNDPTIEKVRASYLMLRHKCELITVEFSKKEILEVRDKYIDIAEKILNEKQFEASVTKLCEFCEGAELCEKYKEKKLQTNTFKQIDW